MITLSFFDLPYITDKRIYDTFEQYGTGLVDLSGANKGYNWRYLAFADRPSYFGIQNVDDFEAYLSTQTVNGLSGGTGYFGALYADRPGIFGIKIIDSMESYANGTNVAGLCGGTNLDGIFWPSAYIDVGPPSVIITQPSNIFVVTGDTATLSVVASGGIAGYQWQKNGVNLTDTGQFTGTSSSSLMVIDVEPLTNPVTDTYDVVITGDRNTVTSNIVNITSGEATADWVTRIIAGGGITPLSSSIAAVSAFYYGLRKDGLYSKMVAVNCLVPDSLVAAQTPIIVGKSYGGKDVWTNNNFTTTDLSVSGLKGNASNKFFDTGIAAILHPALSAANNGGVTVYVQQGSNTGTIDIGTTGFSDTASHAFNLFVNWSDTSTIFDCYGANGGPFGGGRISAINSNWAGYITGDRTSSTSIHVYKASPIVTHTELISSANPSDSTPDATSMYVFAAHRSDNAAIIPTDHRLSFAAIHQGLSASESLQFYNRIATLRQSLGGGESVTYFLSQPKDLITSIGNNAVFTVSAVGTSVTYQWRKNNINLSDGGNIAGSQTPSLSVTNVTLADSTVYQCAVSSNTVGSLVSRYTNLIIPALQNPAVVTWANRVLVNGGGLLGAKTLSAVDTFYTGLGLSGLSAKMLMINVFAPDSLIAAFTPLILGNGGNDPWINTGFTSSNLSLNGLAGNGSNWLNTGFNTTAFTSNSSAGITMYCSAFAGTGSSGDFGNFSGGGSQAFYLLLRSSGTFGACWNNGSDQVGGTAPLSAGFYLLTRVSAASSNIYFANSWNPIVSLGVDTTTSVTQPVNLPCYMYTLNNSNAGILTNTSNTYSFVATHFGLTSTEASNFHLLVRALRQGIGGGSV